MTQWGKRPDMVVHESDPYNAEPPLEALAGLMVTPVDTFYVRNHGPVPEVDAEAWRLVVLDGARERLRLSLAELQERPSTRRLVTLQCAGNRRSGFAAVREIPGEDPWRGGATSTAWWTGVPLADVLAEAGLDAGSGHVAFEAPDVTTLATPAQPYGSSIPMSTALAGGVLLAWAMNDEPLGAVHGAPLRVVVPGHIGARSVKWLERVVVQELPSDNYFQATAYRVLPPEADPDHVGPDDGISLGPVALNCEILQPRAGQDVGAGAVEVVGYAHAGAGRYVARVDVSVDGGAHWVQADLGEQVDGAWRTWRVSAGPVVGAAEVVARAWDSTGACQPSSPEHLWNPKGYVNNSWPVVPVRGA